MKTANSRAINLFFIAAFVLLTGALFLNLGMAPLRLEEPRRALIALEMIFNDNFIVPTEFGEFYYNKPPLWNWLIILAFNIFGSYSEFAVRFFSALSYIAAGVLLFLAGRKYVSAAFGMLSCMFFLISIDTLFYFSLLGEIDLFHAFLLFAAALSLFHFYENGKKTAAFLLFYFFCSLAALSKGLPSVVFAGATAVVFLFWKKRIKDLFSFSHIAGAALYVLIVGGYFFLYSRQRELSGFLATLFDESAKRTVVDSSAAGDFFRHFLFFPVETLKNLLPASAFILLLFDRQTRGVLLKNKYIAVSLLFFAVNFLVYWLSPGSKQRYIYMLYPMAINVLVFAFMNGGNPFLRKAGHVVSIALFAAVIAGFAGMPFIKDLAPAGNIVLISLIFSLASAFLFYGYIKFPAYRVWHIVLLFVALRYAFDVTVIPVRRQSSPAAGMKAHGEKIASLTRGGELYIYGETACPRNTVFYIERNRRETLSRNRSVIPGAYYIVESALKFDAACDTVYSFNTRSGDFHLMKIRQ